MMRTIEATIDQTGTVRLLEPVQVDGPRRALVTILDEASLALLEPLLLSEAAFADGWSGPEADAAWAHLADLPSLDEDEP